MDVWLYYPFMRPGDTEFFEVHCAEQLDRNDLATLDAYFALEVLMRAREPGAVTVGALAERLDSMCERIAKDGSKHRHDTLFGEKINRLLYHCHRLRLPPGCAKVWARPIVPPVR